MVCDFFYPQFGGVESHLYHLSQCLIKRGHKVVIVTHSYGDRHSVRYMTGGLKCYYLPFVTFYESNTVPTLINQFPLLRNILLRERVDIVHGHGAFSVMCHEALLHARTMGYKTCFTDHSLFGFRDGSSIHTNKILKFSLSDCHHVICVSYTSKENTVLRAQLDPSIVSVIPNAVDTTVFTPNPSARDRSKITIVVMSRLVYRKGLDLVVDVIPIICQRNRRVHWVIGGDGPKRLALEEMIEKHQLHDRVELLGAVQHRDVRDVLVRGDIFLNSSLTEAFCIAIVEAASCGLLVVSTRVGGVPEVLPPKMLKLASANVDDIARVLEDAISEVHEVRPMTFHESVKEMYTWDDVAERTERVYDRVNATPNIPLIERFRRFYGCGVWAGKLFCLVVALDHLWWCMLEYLFPATNVEIAPDLTADALANYESRSKSERNVANSGAHDFDLTLLLQQRAGADPS